jgi:hypothetical protein
VDPRLQRTLSAQDLPPGETPPWRPVPGCTAPPGWVLCSCPALGTQCHPAAGLLPKLLWGRFVGAFCGVAQVPHGHEPARRHPPVPARAGRAHGEHARGHASDCAALRVR